MKYFVVSIRDIGSHEYKGLTLEPTEYSALRGFESSVLSNVARKEGLLYSHPEDFELHVLGEFDSSNGQLEPVKCYSLCRGDDFTDQISKGAEI